MRKFIFLPVMAIALAVLTTGCSGPAYKLGRGINNFSEPFRLGEMRRSIEQASLWEGPHAAFTFGAIQGFNRTVMRTAVGVAEIATFPFPTPSYDAFYVTGRQNKEDVYIAGPFRWDQVWSLDWMTTEPRYPDNFAPGLLADSLFATDTALGFSAGDIAPFVPGSRFHIFDY
jgi:putative exosortase-associated protein (TIGR04073 family)